jgi:glycine betaine/proline transport system substrate-binding protein
MLARCRLLLLVLLFSAASVVQAQESSIEVLESPSGDAAADEAAGPPLCGTQPLSIASMQWPSAAILAQIHARLLAEHLECEVRMQEGDLAATGTSMGATGQPAVAPEMWISRIADIWNAAIQAQKVRQAGSAYEETVFEGWFVPEYTARSLPGVTTVEGLKQHAAAFGQGGGRGRFISCPPDWACNLINRNLLRANGLAEFFEVVEPANRFELDTLVAEAVSRREPILFYYWQPNAILAQFAFREVALGPYDKETFLCMGRASCASTTSTGFAPEPVVIAVAEWVFLEAPDVASYFQRAKMPLAEMNGMLLRLSQTGETIDSVVAWFLAERQAVWGSWVGLPVEAGGLTVDPQ